MPAFPSNIIATPADTTITLKWDPVEGATGYEVYADGTTVQVTDSSRIYEWLRTGTYHAYKIRSIKGGTYSVWSALMNVRTTGEQVLTAPTSLRAERFETSIKITWKAAEETVTGYDIEADGKVVGTGTTTSYTHDDLMQVSQPTYRVRAKDGITLGPWSDLIKVSTVFIPTGTFSVNVNVDPSAERAPISPYIYGTNDDLTGTENWTARRMGGNRLSTYNWENNASNAGKDYFWQSDSYIPWYFGNIMDRSKYDIPGIGATAFHERWLNKGSYSLLALQTAGYVAADRNETPVTETAPSQKWVEVKAAKGAPFSLTPDLNDNKVYMDEFVNLLVNRFGNASSPTGVKGFEIDNEPALWAENHKYMHPVQAAKIFNNYDGKNAKYGNTSVKTETSDTENSSVYGSVYTDRDNNLHLIAINKNFDFDMNAVINIAGRTNYTSAKVWAFDSASSAITERQGVATINGNTFTLNIPKLTVAHIVLSAAPIVK